MSDETASRWTLKGFSMAEREAIKAAAENAQESVARYLWRCHEGHARAGHWADLPSSAVVLPPREARELTAYAPTDSTDRLRRLAEVSAMLGSAKVAKGLHKPLVAAILRQLEEVG
jgi:hypothetical protein